MKICPLREITKALHQFRQSGCISDKSFETSECIRERCEWFNEETKICNIASKLPEKILND